MKGLSTALHGTARVLTFVAIAGVIAACAPATEQFFTSPCAAPCWFGVTPGKTTKEELRNLIPSFPYVADSDTQWWSDPGHVPSSVTVTSPDGSAEVSIDTEDGTVGSIRISSIGSLLRPGDMGYYLRDVITDYGEPDLIILGAGCGGDVYCLALYLVYPSILTVVSAETSEAPQNIHLPPTLRVNSLGFVEPGGIDQYLREQNLGYSIECLRKRFAAPWPGYEVLHFDGGIHECAE